MKEDSDEKFREIQLNVYGLGVMVKVSEESFHSRGFIYEIYETFPPQKFYIYGISNIKIKIDLIKIGFVVQTL